MAKPDYYALNSYGEECDDLSWFGVIIFLLCALLVVFLEIIEKVKNLIERMFVDQV